MKIPKSLKYKYQSGESTWELMLSLALLVICIGGIIVVIFGNQFLSLDSEMSNLGIDKAQAALEQQRANAKDNFYGLVAGASTDGPYTKNIFVNDLNQCQKEVTSEVSWYDGVRQQKVSLTTLVSNIDELSAVNGVCANANGLNSTVCPTAVSWSTWSSALPGGGTVKGLFVVNKTVHIAANPTGSAASDYDYLRFTVSSGLVFNNGTFNKSPSGVRTSSGGLYQVAVDEARGLAFAAGKYSTTAGKLGQVQVINNSDITRPASIAFALDTNLQDALSIFYRSNKIYVGTKANPADGEFYIVDVSDPESPQVLASKEVGFDVKKIVVRGSLAYLATGDASNEVKVFDISQVIDIAHPGVINPVGNFNASLLSGSNTIAVLGATVFLGGLGSNNFYEADTKNASALTEITNKAVGGSINDLAASSNLAYLATNGANLSGNELEIWNYNDIANPQVCSAASQNLPVSASAVALDGGWVYVGLNTQSQPIRIFKFQ